MEYMYACMLLHKLGKEINEGNIKKVDVDSMKEIEKGTVTALESANQRAGAAGKMVSKIQVLDFGKYLETGVTSSRQKDSVSKPDCQGIKKDSSKPDNGISDNYRKYGGNLLKTYSVYQLLVKDRLDGKKKSTDKR